MKEPKKMDESFQCAEVYNLLRWAKVQAHWRQAGRTEDAEKEVPSP